MRKKALAIFSYSPLSFSLNTRAKAISAVLRPQDGPGLGLWARKPLQRSLVLLPCTVLDITVTAVALHFLTCAMGRTDLLSAKCLELFHLQVPIHSSCLHCISLLKEGLVQCVYLKCGWKKLYLPSGN